MPFSDGGLATEVGNLTRHDPQLVDLGSNSPWHTGILESTRQMSHLKGKKKKKAFCFVQVLLYVYYSSTLIFRNQNNTV